MRVNNPAYLFGAEDDGDHAFGLGRLHAFVDQDRVELEAGQSRVAGTDAGAADDVGGLQERS